MKLSLLFVLLLLPQSTAPQIATTADGRKVALNADGTWKYIESPIPSVTLTLRARIVYKRGGPEPVARVTFALLDRFSAEELAKLPARADGGYEYPYSGGQGPENARQLTAAHTAYTLTTDFEGKAELTGIKPGQYVILGSATTRGGCAFWTVKIDLSKNLSLALNQNNAAYIK